MVRSRVDLHYIGFMDLLQIIMVVFMLGALGAVVIGVIAMAVNGKLNKNHSNKLMRLRVLFQAIAVLVFVIIIWLSRN
ncbi:twin transmembrane helix small protein [Alphaproteobacteria bacterium]|nr:twin transmembrane helix small protein [Alphaproteobacteria bacterium]